MNDGPAADEPPITGTHALPSYARILTRTVFYLWVSQFALLAAIQNPGNDYDKALLTRMVDGTGHKPFVLRTLLPTTVRLILAVIPDSLENTLQDRLGDFELFALTSAPDEDHVSLYLVAYTLEWLALIGWLIVLRQGLIHFYGDRGLVTDMLPILAGMLLPCLYRHVAYDYDFPQLFLFTTGLLLLLRHSWRAYYPILLLAALGKETALLLPIVHLLGRDSRLTGSSWMKHALAQLGIVGIVRVVLQFVVFADNPGTGVEVWFSRNVAFLSNTTLMWFWFNEVGHYSLFLPATCNVLFLLGLPLVVWEWSSKPTVLRRALWITPLLVVLTFIMGQVDEVRVYYPLVPIFFWLSAHTLLKMSPRVGSTLRSG